MWLGLMEISARNDIREKYSSLSDQPQRSIRVASLPYDYPWQWYSHYLMSFGAGTSSLAIGVETESQS